MVVEKGALPEDDILSLLGVFLQKGIKQERNGTLLINTL
jgi:hypothetical protein